MFSSNGVRLYPTDEWNSLFHYIVETDVWKMTILFISKQHSGVFLAYIKTRQSSSTI